MKPSDVDSNLQVIDFDRGLSEDQLQKLHAVATIPASTINDACAAFDDDAIPASARKEVNRTDDSLPVSICTVYEHADFPGEFWRSWGLVL
jgi:hypothetical protein